MPKENRMPGFHVYKGTKKGSTYFYWNFYSVNGRIISRSSEMYTYKQSATKSIKSMLTLVDARDLNLYYDHTKAGVVDLIVIK